MKLNIFKMLTTYFSLKDQLIILINKTFFSSESLNEKKKKRKIIVQVKCDHFKPCFNHAVLTVRKPYMLTALTYYTSQTLSNTHTCM